MIGNNCMKKTKKIFALGFQLKFCLTLNYIDVSENNERKRVYVMKMFEKLKVKLN